VVVDQRIDWSLAPLRASVKRQYHRDMDLMVLHPECRVSLGPYVAHVTSPALTRGYPVPLLACGRITRSG